MNFSKYKLLKLYAKVTKKLSKYTTEQIITCLQKISWFFLVSLIFVIIGNLISGNAEKVIPLVAAVGIIISALLASYAMILNISKNIELKNRDIELKNREHSNMVKNVFFKLCLLKMKVIELKNQLPREKISYLDLDRIFDTIEDMREILHEVNTLEVVTITHNSVLGDIHFIYLEIISIQTGLSSMNKNICRPENKNYNIGEPLVPNPLKIIKLPLERLEKYLTNTLTYYKNGYEKDFPNLQSIESCAEYSHSVVEKSDSKSE